MSQAQQALLEKSQASLQAAELLLDNGHVDSAISRAYYITAQAFDANTTCKFLTLAQNIVNPPPSIP